MATTAAQRSALELASDVPGETFASVFAIDDGVVSFSPVQMGDRPAGELFDPVSGTTARLPDVPMNWRGLPAVAWTGAELVVAGASSGEVLRPFGAVFDLSTNSWRTISDPPIARSE